MAKESQAITSSDIGTIDISPSGAVSAQAEPEAELKAKYLRRKLFCKDGKVTHMHWQKNCKKTNPTGLEHMKWITVATEFGDPAIEQSMNDGMDYTTSRDIRETVE